uniref:BHLH domain-containing protein n=1 Tax=Aegilops tauschii subsp. strangulata TaxID=200361 RepID=A0A453CAE4_AEGTS
MMMTQVANHSKRNHTDSYFSGKQQQQQQQAGATTTSGGSEEFAGMGSKKPRNASPRGSGGPISPKEKKDKVGERVAALQQLVSPFGKVLQLLFFRRPRATSSSCTSSSRFLAPRTCALLRRPAPMVDAGPRPLQPAEPRPVPGAGGADAAADPEQRGRPLGAGEHHQTHLK